MTPPPGLAMARATRCDIRKTPVRFVAMTARQSSSLMSRNGVSSSMPALLTSTSIRSQRSSAAADGTVDVAPSGTRRRCTTQADSAQSRRSPPAVHACARRSITSAPSDANRSAIARPIPRPAPVTMTRLAVEAPVLLSLHRPGRQAADEEALAEEVDEEHRHRGEQHPRHRDRDVQVVACSGTPSPPP